MADEVVRRIGRDLMFRALESPHSDAYLLGLTDGLAAASQLIYRRIADPERPGEAPVGEQQPLSRLDELDQLLTDVERPRRRRGVRRRDDQRIDLAHDNPAADEDVDTQANWIAALAIGLVHDHEPTEEDVREVAATSRDNPDALRQAATKIERLPRFDPTAREMATDLLRRAVQLSGA